MQQHSVVMVRGGRAQDCPGVKYHLVRGALDLVCIKIRTRRSCWLTKRREVLAAGSHRDRSTEPRSQRPPPHNRELYVEVYTRVKYVWHQWRFNRKQQRAALIYTCGHLRELTKPSPRHRRQQCLAPLALKTAHNCQHSQHRNSGFPYSIQHRYLDPTVTVRVYYASSLNSCSMHSRAAQNSNNSLSASVMICMAVEKPPGSRLAATGSAQPST